MPGEIYLPSVATEESGLTNHLPRGRKFSVVSDLYMKQNILTLTSVRILENSGAITD